MNLPEHLHDMACEQLSIDLDTARRKNLWAVVLELEPYQDGDRWRVLLGKDIQEGVCGFGDSPYDAMLDFEKKFM